MDPDVFSFMGVMGTIAVFIFVMTMARGMSRRLGGGRSRGGCSCVDGDHEELEHLRERVADLEYSGRRIEELEERVDFAERLLAETKHPERVAGSHDTNTLG
ncbi:MAG: hypothetical protein V3T16_09990 [Gemmatimonadales bacterium]